MSMRYRSCRADYGKPRSRLRELAQQRRRFNGRMRDELLNETLFWTIGQARSILARRVDDYTTERLHS